MKTTLRLLFVSLLLIGVASFAQEQAPAVTHNTWSSSAPMPTAVEGPAGTAVLKGEIYVLGGVNSSGSIIADTQIYNPTTETWTAGVALPSAICCWGAAAVVKNVLYVIGGNNGTEATDQVWAYSPKTKTWTSKSPMPTARNSTWGVVENNIIYVIGGNGNDGDLRLNTVESYNPATDTWTEESPLINGKSEPTGGLVGKTIVAADGDTSSGDTGDNEGYDAATNSWTAYTPDPTPRNGACGGGIGAKMYVAGGYPAGSPGTPAYSLTESFTISKNKWATLAPMPQAEVFGSSAVYKGQLYCFGGQSAFDELGTILNTVQIYQP